MWFKLDSKVSQTWFKGESNLIQMWVKLYGNVIQIWFKRDFYCILRMLSISKSSFLVALAWNEFQACYTTMGVAEVNRRSPFVLREATIDTRCWEWLMVHIRVFGSPNVCRDNPNCELDLPIWKIKKYSIGTTTRCLKITEKVSFNIASEASYVYILSGQKIIKKSQK